MAILPGLVSCHLWIYSWYFYQLQHKNKTLVIHNVLYDNLHLHKYMKEGHCDPFMILQCIKRWCPRNVKHLKPLLECKVKASSKVQSQGSFDGSKDEGASETEQTNKIKLARARDTNQKEQDWVSKL